MRAMLIAALLLIATPLACGKGLATITAGELTSTIYTDLLGDRTTTTMLPIATGSILATHYGPQLPGAETDHWPWDTLGNAAMYVSDYYTTVSVMVYGQSESLSWPSGEHFATTDLVQTGWAEFDVPETRLVQYGIGIDTRFTSFLLDGQPLDPHVVPFSSSRIQYLKLTAGQHRIDFAARGFGQRDYTGFSLVSIPEPPAWCLALLGVVVAVGALRWRTR